METLNVSQTGRVATVTLDRPDVRNAFNDQVVVELTRVFREMDESVQVVVLEGVGKSFCAGADLNWMKKSATYTQEQNADDARAMLGLFDAIDSFAGVVIGRVHGAALGGGFELALACDLRLAAEEAQMGLPEGRLGLVPGAGGTQRLTKICGPGIASRIILTCEIVTGETACDLGMVQWTESKSSLKEAALAASKIYIAAVNIPTKDGFKEEVTATQRLIETEDTRNRVTRFLEQNLN